MRYAIDNGARIIIPLDRKSEQGKDEKFTNKFCLNKLFEDKEYTKALSEELKKLTVENYIRTLKDDRFSEQSEFREFGKTYSSDADVYIKTRVEVIGDDGSRFVFVMSFHFAMFPLTENKFPYRKADNGNKD